MPAPSVWSPAYFLLVLVMWWVMMAAMMLPSAAPTILQRRAHYSPVRRIEPESHRARQSCRPREHVCRRLHRSLGWLQPACYIRPDAARWPRPAVTDDEKRERTAGGRAAHRCRRLPDDAAQARLPPSLPRTHRLLCPPLAPWSQGSVLDGTRARRILSRMLLGNDGSAVLRRCHERALDRGPRPVRVNRESLPRSPPPARRSAGSPELS
jgi:hypothetical protein